MLDIKKKFQKYIGRLFMLVSKFLFSDNEMVRFVAVQ